jgi:DNA topoisomerase I
MTKRHRNRRHVMDVLAELYDDPERCAEIAGLRYVDGDEPGIRRRRYGRGFSYRDQRGRPVSKAVAARISDLAIPPAWRDVWICPNERCHILATGTDDRGRKQYLYHPRWRELRDVLNFYRLVVFAEQLPRIRSHVAAQLRRRTLDGDRVLAGMVRIIDLSAVRIGTEEYAEENESFGLSTLTKGHVRLARRRVDLSFAAKSRHRVEMTIGEPGIVRLVRELMRQPGREMFAVDRKPITAAEVNAFLAELTGVHITAKDFRTWSGTHAAFAYLREQSDSTGPPERVAVDAVDQAAEVLGNTRAVARWLG